MSTLADSYPVPTGRLHELLGGWSGQGSLNSTVWADLAAVEGEDDTPLAERQWRERDVTRRAHRVLLERLLPQLERWPTRLRAWTEALPAVTTSRRVVSARPLRPTDWVQTARRHGWPPATFIGRQRTSQADELLVSTLRWTLPQVLSTVRHATAVLPGVAAAIETQITVAARLLEEYVGEGEAPEPAAADLAAVARAGYPWHALAPVSSTYLRYQRHLEDLALEVIYPLESLRWRLFHIGVLGEVLGALRDEGGELRWRAPLSAAGGRPQYTAHWPEGTTALEVWFEAAGVWGRHASRYPYREALRSLEMQTGAMGPDILIFDGARRRALVLECKFGDARYVGRNGYLQALAYASELRVDVADEIWAYVVGPEGVVVDSSSTSLHGPHVARAVGVTSPTALPQVVRDFLGAADKTKP